MLLRVVRCSNSVNPKIITHSTLRINTRQNRRHEHVIVDRKNSNVVIEKLDHLSLTVSNAKRAAKFYCDVLGMTAETYSGGTRTALRYGTEKINLVEKSKPHTNAPRNLSVGSADLCFSTVTPVEVVADLLMHRGVSFEGPIHGLGAKGRTRTLYLRDPDHNLIQLSSYKEHGDASTYKLINRDKIGQAWNETQTDGQQELTERELSAPTKIQAPQTTE
mmetsp:Transcript_25323/g.28169  ORF Transcript_25323/g.28169 Transcript_25323/m.28169 type:complete len:219 (+) Transcript_25323:97-753(+)